MKSILVLGIGNYILRDEGIGIHVVKELEKNWDSPSYVRVLDGGTGSYPLLCEIAGYDHVIIIDATLDNNPPGTIRILHPKYAKDYPPLLSAHEFGLKQMIDMLVMFDKVPEFHLVAVSVSDFKKMGMELSDSVRTKFDEIIVKTKNLVSQIAQKEGLDNGALEIEASIQSNNW